MIGVYTPNTGPRLSHPLCVVTDRKRRATGDPSHVYTGGLIIRGWQYDQYRLNNCLPAKKLFLLLPRGGRRGRSVATQRSKCAWRISTLASPPTTGFGHGTRSVDKYVASVLTKKKLCRGRVHNSRHKARGPGVLFVPWGRDTGCRGNNGQRPGWRGGAWTLCRT